MQYVNLDHITPESLSRVSWLLRLAVHIVGPFKRAWISFDRMEPVLHFYLVTGERNWHSRFENSEGTRTSGSPPLLEIGVSKVSPRFHCGGDARPLQDTLPPTCTTNEPPTCLHRVPSSLNLARLSPFCGDLPLRGPGWKED